MALEGVEWLFDRLTSLEASEVAAKQLEIERVGVIEVHPLSLAERKVAQGPVVGVERELCSLDVAQSV